MNADTIKLLGKIRHKLEEGLLEDAGPFAGDGWDEEKKWLAQARKAPPTKVDAARATEIVKTAKSLAKHGPWVDQLSRAMTQGEYRYVNDLWSEMPGSTSFYDTLMRLKQGKAEDHVVHPAFDARTVAQLEQMRHELEEAESWYAQRQKDPGRGPGYGMGVQDKTPHPKSMVIRSCPHCAGFEPSSRPKCKAAGCEDGYLPPEPKHKKK